MLFRSLFYSVLLLFCSKICLCNNAMDDDAISSLPPPSFSLSQLTPLNRKEVERRKKEEDEEIRENNIFGFRHRHKI